MSNFLRMLIMGPPGCGKGTISARIVKDFGFSYIACGDLLRSHVINGTEEGRAIKELLDKGKFAPDHVVTKLVFKELDKLSSSNWLLDGYPRSIVQAESLTNKLRVSSVINLNIPDEVIIDRLKGRLVHLSSGRIYHTEFNPPKTPGVDDVTGEPLEQRADDMPDVVKTRLNNYTKVTEPVLNYYKKKGLVREFTGKTSNEIWVFVKQYMKELMSRV